MCRIKKNSVNLFSCMEVQIKYKRTIGKESTADLYRAASNWLKKFKRYHVLGLSEVTPTLVDDFIRYLQQRGTLKVNTINSYICAFRAMYNVSIRERHYTPRTHPFAHVVIPFEQST